MAGAWRSNLGRFAKEIRIHLCQTSENSKGVRNFLEKNYTDIKKANPKFPILVRECSGVFPKMYARYGYGKEVSVELSDMKSEEVNQVMEKLVTSQPE
ncbi:NADH dehydrogenase [ubiquinone] 1 alpha subcomplex subunit 2 [Exaiptasia diaphana]|uniref:NADH dehydrogenase [ubiquinone] 1 alpha subcomplex subunit 2 n=1 Tax=Exaiptasia diaphana TaxID=2652724 RepID=A0A913YAI7_EXADI|nr:NADH dehydrogenase [ubiquinone] 1 alpha subcomplex subunit 2 [Exaiptasia diaphana]KXJ19306.1 NADH dehydrogenase [ubiquinone] 1 alpha subcomplex subunit 2 [Exaiptasia diaphana]